MGKFRFLYMALLAFCFGFIICSAVPSLKAEESKRALTIDDLFKLKTVGDPQVSPEGMWIAYTIREVDLEKDKSETRVWMASVSGGPTQLVVYPNVHHSITRPSFRKNLYQRYLAWFDKHGKSIKPERQYHWLN